MDETFQAALAGGALIGLAAVLLMLTLGRIAGISGIVGALVDGLIEARRPEGLDWRLAFVAGLVIGPGLVAAIAGAPPRIEIDAGWLELLIAGLLVGLGVRLGNGCTSGHGVCGLARGSPRSIVATGIFMAVAIAVVFVVRHVLGG